VHPAEDGRLPRAQRAEPLAGIGIRRGGLKELDNPVRDG
jgi:hypothetical protein